MTYLNGIVHSHKKTEKVFFFWQLEMFDVCRVTRGAHIEHLLLSKKKLFQFSCGCEQFH
jgi:hypothetical protein